MTDSEWVRAAVAQYEGPLIRYALRFSGDVDTARDIVQDTFLKLCRADRTEVEAFLAQWLYTVCRNRALDVCRKEGRMNHVNAEVAEMASERIAPTAALERGETMSRVLAHLALLPPRQQEVIRLKFQEGLSYKEIAGITQLTANHVGVIIHEGIKTLRARLGATPRMAREA